MDANELAVIAYDAMPVEVLTPHDQGVVYGVLQMALRTLETQYESLLAEADNEAAEARKLLAEATLQRDTLSTHLDKCRVVWRGVEKERDTAIADAVAMKERLDAMAKENVLANMPLHSHSEFEELRKERDNAIAEANRLTQENARLHRSLEERMSVRIPGAVKVADEPKRIHYGSTFGHLEA